MPLTVLGRLSSSFRQTWAVPSPSAAGRTSSSQPSISSPRPGQTTGGNTPTGVVTCYIFNHVQIGEI